MERAAAAIWQPQYLLAPAQILGGDGYPAQTLARLLGSAE
jgi:hypothetical protein